MVYSRLASFMGRISLDSKNDSLWPLVHILHNYNSIERKAELDTHTRADKFGENIHISFYKHRVNDKNVKDTA